MSEPNKAWRLFSSLCTCFIPTPWLSCVGKNPESIQAWREKVALCFIMLCANVGFLGFGGLIPMILCGTKPPPCGEGVVGSGVCVDGLCCSQWGWCGTTPEHCASRQLLFLETDNLHFTSIDEHPSRRLNVANSTWNQIVDSVDDDNPSCRALNIFMLTTMLIIVLVLAVQLICSLIYLARVGRWCRKEVVGQKYEDAKVIVMVPCYNEGIDELQKTIDSVRDENYPNENKLLLFVSDGNVLGKNSYGEDNHGTTPVILSELLGYTRADTDRKLDCDSTGFVVGNNDEKIPIGNRAKVYHGVTHGSLNYMVIEKCGLEENERDVGNRGKRDSQVMLIQLLNKVLHNKKLKADSAIHRDLNEAEVAINDALELRGFSLTDDDARVKVKYLMAVDADTELANDSITQMIYSMESDPKTLALCGETKVANKKETWVTKIQVFEYYTNHGLKKAFESVFNTVTCLPGCFTMYRLFDTDRHQPLFACDYVHKHYSRNDAEVNTLHEKNLYKLGEDRMLTTLLLQRFQNMNLKYVPEAHAYTIVPSTFSVLLSQRRRWVNSTFHNMLYLLGVNLGGVCCFSMKFIVILDMIGTLILPSSLIYLIMMVVNATVGQSELSIIILVVLGFSVLAQIIGPLLRLKLAYLWSAIIFYLVGVPVFYFILPIYSFWHLDDFSWGSTRIVSTASTSSGVKK